MARGECADGEGRVLAPARRFKRGLRIFYYRELAAGNAIPFKEEILHHGPVCWWSTSRTSCR
jgi:tRNA pseudouridine32 synthase/23S rRNA pseudouridine746 synthase